MAITQILRFLGAEMRQEAWPVVKDGKLQYPTSEEAAYPHLLCERIVACVMTQVLQLGAISIQTFQQQAVLQQSTTPEAHCYGGVATWQQNQTLGVGVSKV